MTIFTANHCLSHKRILIPVLALACLIINSPSQAEVIDVPASKLTK